MRGRSHMIEIEAILQSKIKPKEKLNRLVKSLLSREIPAREFVRFFESASEVEKGTCAHAMKLLTEQDPSILAPHHSLDSG